jgi:signal transduction histidine kinase/CheY-like chemotaxis protein/HPt (histidine-containing phosphotransfer) domain-containing protein
MTRPPGDATNLLFLRSVRLKILAASLGFVLIVALLGLLARQQVNQLGALMGGIYDHSFIGSIYVNQAQAQLLRLIATEDAGIPLSAPARRTELQAVLDRLDIAIERADSGPTREAARAVRDMLARLPATPPAALRDREAEADHAIAQLVRAYATEGLKTRDQADALVVREGRLLLGGMALAFTLALTIALLLGRNLSPPLIELVASIGLLTAGDLEHEVSPRLTRRQDEIGAVARATSFFRETMQKNIAAGEERVRLEAENVAARLSAERSEAAIAAKSDFLATMSHEIRTPMNGVATIADLLAESQISAEQLKMVNIIRQSARWLIRVINDILDFSKLEARQLHIESVPFMLDEVILSSCEVLAAKAREKGLALRVEGKDLPGICRIGDPLRLRQILLNLLGNAVKFTATGSVTLILRARTEAISLSIVDTGIGIPADKIDSLFQPYNQLRADAARSYGGTGLGLSITRNLISLMSGALEVTSELGHGSSFTASLPMPSDVASLSKAAQRAAGFALRWQKPDLAKAAVRGAVVLCAEDNAINREVLGRVLDRLGFNHEMAEDGGAALALLDRARHGVVLTDAQMPQLDGWALAEAIRREEAAEGLARLPVVMLTANALSESDSRISAVGIDAVLTKPLDMGALEATLIAAAEALGTLRIAAAQEAAAPPAPPAKPPGPELDLDVLVDLVGDDPETISEMLNDFLASVIAQHGEVRAALASRDLSSLARHAHAMKGASRYAGAKHLAGICERIEKGANAGAAPPALAGDLASLDAAVERLPGDIAVALSGLACAA